MKDESKNMNFDYFKGWKYINALFCAFQREALNSKKSHIAPRYIYRGISKRFFTESQKISEIISDFKADEAFEKLKSTPVNLTEKSNYCVTLSDLISYFKELGLASKSKDATKPHLPPIKPKDCFKDTEILDLSHLNPRNIYQILYKHLLCSIDEILKTESGSTDQAEDLLLDKIVDDPLYSFLIPEQIRSGASIRLRDTENDYNVIADYISYIKNLISGFKTVNPEYKEFDDLEILAEIQHRGGASCLVDFSNNFLISLWFAVRNHMDEMGYLFCYDVNEDAFVNDKLTYLNYHKWDKGIENLLNHSRKFTTYLDKALNRFWLWRPSNINGRIARQDSIFIFGITAVH